MNVALHRPAMSLAEFLDWDDAQDQRFEFDGIAPVAMVGATVAHNTICGNLVVALKQRLAAPCRVFVEGVRLRMAHAVRYPDVMVVRAPVRAAATEVTEPLVVIEVLSPNTARTDRIDKNREYAAHPSIQRYVLLEQDAIAAEVYAREAGRWVRATLIADGVLAMPELGIEFPLADAYDGLDLADPPAPG